MSIAITTIRNPFAERIAKAKAIAFPSLRELASINKSAILSAFCALMFMAYLVVPHIGVAASVFQYSMLYIVALPLAAFVLSIVSVRQIHKTHERGVFLGYAALGISSLYLIVATAIPVVLLGLYIVYTFIL